MADGFKIADAFVEVEARLDDSAIRRSSERAGRQSGEVIEGQLADAGSRSGESFGRNFTMGADGRIRDMKGRFVKTAGDFGGEGGKSSGDRWGSSFGSRALSFIGDTAKKGGKFLTDGLGNVGPAGPVIGGVILGAVAATAPLAGAMLGGALLGGVAAAGIGIGVAASMRHPAVKGAAVGLKGTILGEVNKIADDWAPTMVGAIDMIRGAVPGIGSELRSALAPAKSLVAPLLQGFLNLVRNVMPGFRDVLANARPIVDAIASGLAGLGTDLSDTLSHLSQYSDEFASALQAAFMIAGGLIRAGGDILAWLAQAYSKTLDWAIAFSDFMSHIPGVGDKFDEWNAKQRELKATADGVRPSVDGLGAAMLTQSATSRIAANASEEFAKRQQILNGSFRAGIDAGEDLAGVFDLLNGKAQGAEQAEIAYQEAIDQATASIKENSKTTDANTAKGRANRSALLALAQAGVQRAQAQYDQTLATKGTTAAEGAAQRAYSQSRSALISTARQMGMTKREAEAYANRIMAIPKSWSTTVTANTGQAMSRLQQVRNIMASIKDKRVTVSIVESVMRQDDAMARRGRGMSAGGPVIGTGPKGFDSEPRLLAPGEHVLTDKEVDAMGGHAKVEAFRRSLRAGIPSAPSMPAASSASSARGGDTHVHIGSITLDASRLRSIQDVIDMIEGITVTARSRYARRPAIPGSVR